MSSSPRFSARASKRLKVPIFSVFTCSLSRKRFQFGQFLGLLPKDCGIPGDPAEALRNGGEDVMLIKPTELLRVDNKSALSPLREDETSSSEILTQKFLMLILICYKIFIKCCIFFLELLVPEGMLRRTLLGFNHDLKIVNGNETGVNEFPWQVLLLVNGKPICGGSLISEDMVLTAGHCSSIL